ncbi:MAG TPA: type II toxin-antitoxin system RatA family toxin [Rhizomicrobium sp.]|nr:type II toxin-antitoxin system RatA family toxin [Rhizomicrobium sp.]
MHKEVRLVPHSAELMYRVVADVEQYPQFLPWVLGLRVKSRSGHIVFAEMMVGYKSFREKYTSKIVLDPAALTVNVTQADGPFRKLETHWRFTPRGPQACEVHFAIDFEFRNRLLGAVAGAAFEKALLRMTEAFEARAAALSRSHA